MFPGVKKKKKYCGLSRFFVIAATTFYTCLKSLQTDHKGAVEFYFELPNALPCIKINTIKWGFFFYTYIFVHFVVFNAVLLTITTVFITLQKIF